MMGDPTLVLQSGLIPTGSRVAVFQRIFVVFLVLGTIVGVIVIAYMLYNAYKYRADADTGYEEEEVDRPQLGELPSGGGHGRKLFLSFGLSTIVVVSLIVWTYGTLLYVEEGAPTTNEDAIEVTVTGYQFGWKFTYENGHTENGVLRVPVDRDVRLTVTSEDVFHNFGIPALRVKADAIRGQTTETWFIAEETGEYQANCYELCGVGHSAMHADVVVMEPAAYEQWYANTTASNSSSNSSNTTATATESGSASHAMEAI